MNLALLQCDHVLPALQPEHGDYPQMFTRFLKTEHHDVNLTFFDVTKMEYPKFDSPPFDAYVITGSSFSAYEDLEWIHVLKQYVRALCRQKQKTVGICFGHQIMAEALGGKVEKSNKGWGVGIKPIDILKVTSWMYNHRPLSGPLRPALSGAEVLVEGCETNDILEPKNVRQSINLIMSHQDQVVELPPDTLLLGTNAHCINNIMQIGFSFLGIQGHPEFSMAYAKGLLATREHIIPKEVYEPALKSLSEKNDSDVMRDWIFSFISADRN